MRTLLYACLFVSIVLGGLGAANAEKRVALVIGNGAYRNVPTLLNPVHDADDIAAALDRMGFSVQKLANADFDEMRRALLQFNHDALGSDMAIIFYAGHGMEIGGENWLIPIDAKLKNDSDTEHEAVGLRSAMLAVAGANKLGVVFLDACRDTPRRSEGHATLKDRRSKIRGFTYRAASGPARQHPQHISST